MKPNIIFKIGRFVSKNYPTIMTIGGTAGVLLGTYLTWKAARKHDEVVAEITEDINQVHDEKPELYLDDETGQKYYAIYKTANGDEYTIKTYRKNITKAWLRAIKKLIKLYGIPFIVIIASLVSIIFSHSIMKSKYSTAVAACGIANKAFMNYRENVIEKYGEEEDSNLYFGIKNERIETPVLDANGEPKLNKKGEPKVNVENVSTYKKDMDGLSEYAIIFDRSCSEYQIGDPAYNRTIIESTQKFLNELIRARATTSSGIGVVVLNEVRERFGPNYGQYKTKSGQVTGWVYNKDSEKAIGDNKIDLRVRELIDEETGDVIYLMDPNVDGCILNYIEESY